MKKRTPVIHNIAFLSDLAVQQDGEFVKVSNTLDANLRALDTAVKNAGTQTDYTLTCTASDSPDYAKVYTLTQRNETVGTINIPKDMVVTSGQVVVNPQGQDEGIYIELTIANATDKVYINVSQLSSVYSVEQQAAEVQLAISPSNEISATIVNASIAKGKLDANVQASLDKADTALQPVSGAGIGDFASFDSNGNIVDSGKRATNFAKTSHTHASLANTDALLILDSSGAATIEVSGNAYDKAILTITGGTVSGTSYDGQEQEPFIVPSGTVEIPLTWDESQQLWTGFKAVGDIRYRVRRYALGVSHVHDDSVSINKIDSSLQVNCFFPVPDTDYANPTLGPCVEDFGTHFDGAIAYSQESDPLRKTIATTDDIPVADNTTIENNNGTLSVKDGGITTAKLASDVTTTLNNAVKVTDLDGTTIEKDATNGVQVKDGAITTAKLANLTSFNLVDTVTGIAYTIQLTNGRLEVVGPAEEEEPEEP